MVSTTNVTTGVGSGENVAPTAVITFVDVSKIFTVELMEGIISAVLVLGVVSMEVVSGKVVSAEVVFRAIVVTAVDVK